MRFFSKMFTAIVLALFACSFASADVVNGGFEAGLTGWTVSNQADGNGSWYAASGTNGPQSNLQTVGAKSGTGYAVSDQTGPGAHALTQSITVGAGSNFLTFDMFINDFDGGPTCGNGLNYTISPSECARVDILTAAATAFDTGAGVVDNLFAGVTPGNPGPNPYIHYTFNLSGLTPGNYQLRFAEVDNQGNFLMGVDNVTLGTPEPSSLLLMGSGLLGGIGTLRRKLSK
jgi:hypothetical protein